MTFAVGVTAHRDLGPRYIRQGIIEATAGRLLQYKAAHPDLRGVTGLACGGDQLFARLCMALHIPFEAYVPFEGQHLTWPRIEQEHYLRLRNAAVRTVVVCVGGYAKWKYHRRDCAIVARCDVLMPLWRGNHDSGTGLTVREAWRVGRPIDRVDPAALDTDPGRVYYLSSLKRGDTVSCGAHILACGRYKPEITDCLDYRRETYAKCQPNDAVFSTLFLCVANDTAVLMREACGGIIDHDASTWKIDFARCDLDKLQEVADRSGEGPRDVEHLRRLHAAGFGFFYFPG